MAAAAAVAVVVAGLYLSLLLVHIDDNISLSVDKAKLVGWGGGGSGGSAHCGGGETKPANDTSVLSFTLFCCWSPFAFCWGFFLHRVLHFH